MKRKITEYTPISCVTTKAYIAGMMDSMVYFSIKRSVLKTHIAWQCKLVVLTTDTRKVEYLNRIFQVSRSVDSSHNLKDVPKTWKGREGKVDVLGWSAGGAFLDYIISIIDPYIVFNREKIELIKQFRSTFNGLGPKRVSEETQYEREIIMEEFRKLQRRCTYRSKQKRLSNIKPPPHTNTEGAFKEGSVKIHCEVRNDS